MHPAAVSGGKYACLPIHVRYVAAYKPLHENQTGHLQSQN